jgi:hypothetical protein
MVEWLVPLNPADTCRVMKPRAATGCAAVADKSDGLGGPLGEVPVDGCFE